MITFKRIGRHGRLGNQLFQYALLLGVSAKTGFKLGIPRAGHWLCEFNLPLDSFVDTFPPTSLFRETQFHFDHRVFDVKDGTDFLGYFQTEKYFLHVADEVRTHLDLSDAYREKAAEDMAEYRNIWDGALPDGYETVMVHVRRGDNVHGGGMNPEIHAQHIPLQPLAYYQNAIRAVTARSKRALAFLVFSDTQEDADWCRENFRIDHAIYRGGPEEFPLWDFAAMLLCDHKIISNSTMSWWAAWLSETPSTIVVRPALWFGPAHAAWNLDDVTPQRWIIQDAS